MGEIIRILYKHLKIENQADFAILILFQCYFRFHNFFGFCGVELRVFPLTRLISIDRKYDQIEYKNLEKIKHSTIYIGKNKK